MKRVISLLLPLAAALLLAACSSDTTLRSPDGRYELRFALDARGGMSYTLLADGEELLLPSALGFESREAVLDSGFRIRGVERRTIDEQWSQPWGENKQMRNHCNEMAVRLSNDAGTRLTMRFRLFDDGVGFRYEYEVPGADSLTITDERTEFRFAADGDSWTIPANFETYELLYRHLPLSELTDANTPATFHVGRHYGSIHEAALYDFPEMTLLRTSPLCFKSELAPLPDGTKARTAGSFTTAWRTVQLADEAVGLINSGLILNLNEPCKIEDTSWIRPMKYVGVWWGMHLGVESWTMDERHGATTENAKRYIAFAAANNIQGVLYEGWNEGWESWGGRQSFDFTRPYADFDMDEVARYAAERGIEIIGHHETGGNIPNYERQLEQAMAWYTDHGVHNLKTGYAGGFPDGYFHHSQYGVRHYQQVVETAARYRMTVNAHEPIKDCGIRRTWPNMMSREGARGMEWNAWSDGNPPSHTVMLPFTRLQGGPMDYTPGTFDILFENTRNSPRRRKWNDLDQGTSRVNTTLAKQIANWVILYSPVQMASDMIEHYEGHPAFQFFRDFDADCDWSRALAGEPGEFVAVVRRAGDRYFLGAATNEQARTLTLPLDFLEAGRRYRATIYADGADADWQSNPTSYTISEREVTAADSLEVRMAPGGGQAVTLIPM